MGFVACVSDTCVFVRRDGNSSWICVTLYVDDMLIGGVSVDSIKQVADELSSQYRLKTLEKVQFIFGIEVEFEMGANQLKIIQSACITRMVEKFNQVIAKPAYNPSVEGQIMVKCERMDPRKENRPIRSLAGSLL